MTAISHYQKKLTAIEELKVIAKVIPVTTILEVCCDPKDNKFLELATETNNPIIITGDKDLLVLHPFKDISIVTAAGFLELDL